MKKVLFATAAAVMATTAAMADVSYNTGKVHALMTVANSFEARGINIVENSNKIAVHKTVNAWNQGWNALEGENTVDLEARGMVYTIHMADNGIIVTDNLEVSADGETATYTNGLGLSFTLDAEDIGTVFTQSVSLRDSRADTVEVQHGPITQYSIGSETTVSNQVLAISGNDQWDRLVDKIEGGIQDAYDTGFEDGYTAGYDDGFAAAKGVVKD